MTPCRDDLSGSKERWGGELTADGLSFGGTVAATDRVVGRRGGWNE